MFGVMNSITPNNIHKTLKIIIGVGFAVWWEIIQYQI